MSLLWKIYELWIIFENYNVMKEDLSYSEEMNDSYTYIIYNIHKAYYFSEIEIDWISLTIEIKKKTAHPIYNHSWNLRRLQVVIV